MKDKIHLRAWFSDQKYEEYIEEECSVFDECSKFYSNSNFHRTDGPALEYANGSEEWWLDGKRHRTDGPAIVYKNPPEEWWFQHGHKHRLCGPAVNMNGNIEWWIHGKVLDTQEVETWLDDNDIDLSTQVGQTTFKLRFG